MAGPASSPPPEPTPPEAPAAPPRRSRVVLVAVLFEGGLGGLAWLLGWLFGQPAAESLRWDARAAGLGAAACAPLVLLFLYFMASRMRPFVRIRELFAEVLLPLFGPCTLFDLAAISLLAGLGEELLFRGLLQALLARWLGPWAALAAASLLFGLVHAITPAYVVIAGLFGAYLGGLWLATGNLLVPIAAHAVYDFLVLVYLLRGPRLR